MFVILYNSPIVAALLVLTYASLWMLFAYNNARSQTDGWQVLMIVFNALGVIFGPIMAGCAVGEYDNYLGWPVWLFMMEYVAIAYTFGYLTRKRYMAIHFDNANPQTGTIALMLATFGAIFLVILTEYAGSIILKL